MSNEKITNRCQISEKEEMMIAGYKEMGMLNVSLSEEGLSLDMKDLESYEKNLVESE